MAKLYCDGAAKNNPGPCACGAVLYMDQKQPPLVLSRALGHGTNNEAEYCGLIMGLLAAHKHKIDSLSVFMDSLLVVKQVSGDFRCKAQHLKAFRDRVRQLLKPGWTLQWVPREDNTEADRQANLALRRDYPSPEMSPKRFLLETRDDPSVIAPVQGKDAALFAHRRDDRTAGPPSPGLSAPASACPP